ncbi:MAG: hypothetical protein V3T70_07175, partial [Phycisphaerae bacterium]
FLVRVVRRPALRSASVRITPPAYASVLGERDFAADDGSIRCLPGSRADIRVEIDKPVGRDADGNPRIQLTDADARQLPCRADDDSDRIWTSALDVLASMTATLSWSDAEGIEPAAPPRFDFKTFRDQPPRVAISRPASFLEVTPSAELELHITAEDDIDVQSIRLHARRSDGTALDNLPAWSGSARDAADDEEKATTEFRPQWSLSSHALESGSSIEYWAEANDGYDGAARSGDPARSAVMRLRIVTPVELEERIRESYAAWLQRLRLQLSEQQVVAEQTAGLAETVPETRSDDAVYDDVRRLLRRQRGIVAAVRAAADRLGKLSERAERNHLAQALIQQIQRLSNATRPIAATHMTKAGDAIERLAAQVIDRTGAAPSAERTALTRAATDAQSRAIAALQRLLADIDRYSNVESVAQKTRELLDRQEALARRTAGPAGAAAGRSVADLPDSQRQALRRLATAQRNLGGELNELIEELDRLARTLRRRDRASAASIDRTRDIAETEGVVEQMQRAAESIRLNQGIRAEEAQHAAAAGLRSMLTAMKEEIRRELNELSRRLADAAAELDRIVEAQQKLNDRTDDASHQADAALALPELAPRQSTLRRTAAKLRTRLRESLQEARRPADLIQDAEREMESATEQLEHAASEHAATAQSAALEALEKAAGALRDLRDQARQEQLQQDLAELRESLAAILEQERALLRETETIDARRRQAGRVNRRDGMTLNRGADTQSDLGKQMLAFPEAAPNAVVFEFVCKRVAKEMQNCAGNLLDHDTTAALELEKRILKRIEDLIALLDEAAARHQARYAQARTSGGGGGGPGESSESPIIPPLAELKMLRSLQADLNTHTVEFDTRVAPRPARTEDELIEAETLGHRQREIHDLATRMIAAVRRSLDR